MILVDTHVLVFDALTPNRLSARARRTVNRAREAGEMCCSDISLWEIAMLIARKRIEIASEANEFIHDVIQASRVEVIPISPEIAVMSQDASFIHGDPADRLIASTALVLGLELVTADDNLRRLASLRTVW